MHRTWALFALLAIACGDDSSTDAGSTDTVTDREDAEDITVDTREPVPDGFYRLDEASRTSAGVFESDGTLVRVLWSGQPPSMARFGPRFDPRARSSDRARVSLSASLSRDRRRPSSLPRGLCPRWP